MNVLFDINHPAHVHLFKNAIWDLQDDGADVLVTSREKEITTDLLDAYGIEYRTISREREGPLSLTIEWAAREVRLLAVARSFDPDVVVSRLNPPLVHVSKLLGVPNVIVTDTEIKSGAIDAVYSMVTDPFIDVYCTPPGFNRPNRDAEHHMIDFQELAYLHPEYFTPDPEPLEAEGVDPDERYFVLRFVAWDAFHDVGYRGISKEVRRELVSYLDGRGEVYITSEDPLPPEFSDYRLPIPPHLVHHLLYYADLYVGDSGTMSSEAAILGTPAVRTNSMVDDDTESIFYELEEEYGLMFSFSEERRALQRVRALLNEDEDGESDDNRWHRKRESLLEDKQNVTRRLVELIRDKANR